MASPIIKFYEGTGTDDQGRTLEQILEWNFQKLESIHNYIQWLFPLTDRSSANWNAPVLTRQEIEEIRSSELIRNNLVRSFRLMMEFYGFDTKDRIQGIPYLERSPDFSKRAANWLTRGNHNFLRLTRIMKSMNLANLNNYSQALFGELEKLYKSDYGSVIGSITFQYWKEAAGKS